MYLKDIGKKKISWRKISILSDEKLANREFWFTIKGVNGNLKLPNKWGIRVDLDKMRYTYDECDYPTLNDLNKPKDTVVRHTPYKRYTMQFKVSTTDVDEKYIDDNIGKILKRFKRKGFNVTETAIRHNFFSWLYGLKSGYKDRANGYHIFTPCGGNPLSFTCTTLHKTARYWQKTYVF